MSITQIDFYLLNNQDIYPALYHLIEPLYLQNKKIYIHAHDNAQAAYINYFLGTYKERAFIAQSALKRGDILLNVSGTIPPDLDHFKMLIELVLPDETSRQLARERFRFYRQNLCEPKSHSLLI